MFYCLVEVNFKVQWGIDGCKMIIYLLGLVRSNGRDMHNLASSE